ncbi:MAG: hypothetical protein JWM58_2718 [Rhizobium sp.]|nr:hypothetical protein [Rhizobium sp.]
MESQYWKSPVELELHGTGKYRTVTGTKHAAECLLTLWPIDEGRAYNEALSDCLAALDGEKPPEAARNAFIRAAAEAHIYVRQK